MINGKPTHASLQENRTVAAKNVLPGSKMATIPTSLVRLVRNRGYRLTFWIVLGMTTLILAACGSDGAPPPALPAEENAAVVSSTPTEEGGPAGESETAEVPDEVAEPQLTSVPTQAESTATPRHAVALPMQIANQCSDEPDDRGELPAAYPVGEQLSAWWDFSSGYTLGGWVENRMVAGDFDGDGLSDIAVFYDYGNGAARIHVFRSTGTAFDYDNGGSGWWAFPSGYTLDGWVDSRMVAGDFDGDGKDDIAVFYDYGVTDGKSEARIHVFRSTGTAFEYDNGGTGWWRSTGGYTLGLVVSRMVAGDFNGDNKDDIATFYDYGFHDGKSEARIHVFRSTGSAFVLDNGGSGWWRSDGGYTLDLVGSRMVAGDFNGDHRDDIATFYDYGVTNGKSEARIHVFRSTGTAFVLDNGGSGWWRSTGGYTLDLVGGRMVAGDFNGDDKDDIATFYDYGDGAAKIHVFRTTGTSFNLANGGEGWWGASSGYSLDLVGDLMVAGNFNRAGGGFYHFDGIATFFAYDTSVGAARIDTFVAFSGCSWGEDDCYPIPTFFEPEDVWRYGRFCGQNHCSDGEVPIDMIDQACQAHDAWLWKNVAESDPDDCANDLGLYHTVRDLYWYLPPGRQRNAAQDIETAFAGILLTGGCGLEDDFTRSFDFFANFSNHFTLNP